MIGIIISLMISQKQICKNQYRQPGFTRDLSQTSNWKDTATEQRTS